MPARLSLKRWKETACPWSSTGPGGEWILHWKLLKLRDWILGDPKGSAFPLLIVPAKLSWQPALLFRRARSLLLQLFGSGVSGCGFSECFPSWLLERWLGWGVPTCPGWLLSGCSQGDPWGLRLHLHSAARPPVWWCLRVAPEMQRRGSLGNDEVYFGFFW